MEKKKILLVEDEAELLEEISDWLRFEDFEVETAANGEEALEKVQITHPDIIISDIMMPVMDGKRLFLELRSKLESYNIPFIFMSALTEREHVRHGMNIGADDYITKPFTRIDLLQAIQARLAKHRQQQEIAEKSLSDLKNRIITQLPKELKIPLNSIMSHGNLLAEISKDFDSTILESLGEEILESANNLNGLIENFLVHIQLQLGLTIEKHLLKPHTIEPILYEESFLKARQFNRANQCKLHIEPAPLNIQEDILRKIVREICSLLFQLSSEESKLVISGNQLPESYSLSFTTNEAILEGITEESIDAFMQLNDNLPFKTNASLSLSIIKQLLELSGGSLKLEPNKHSSTAITCFVAYFV